MTDEADLRVDEHGGGWVLTGPAACRFALANDYLRSDQKHYSLTRGVVLF